MRYIRTKDNVFELDENDIDEKIRIFSLYSYEIYSELKFNALIIKQADTIEELCDEFVVIENGKPRVLDRVITRVIKDKGIKYAEKIYCQRVWNMLIKGAIYTSKGLIYVAEMNERGELELI